MYFEFNNFSILLRRSLASSDSEIAQNVLYNSYSMFANLVETRTNKNVRLFSNQTQQLQT